MAKKWTNSDSARTMTNKYNETAEEVENLKKIGEIVNPATQQQLDSLSEVLKTKAENKSDVGLGNVDNTSDMDKPVSNAQARAIEWATEDMLTSEPADEIESEDTGFFITSISVDGTRLVISI